ncbi:MAG: Usg family protein [Rhodospirillales bacterium]|nr:Usg family protein [Rhodospirillales bacterium]
MLSIERPLLPYQLTTAEITYHLPDYPELLQNYIWQDFDLAPDFPVLRRFLKFWQKNLDGRVHSVSVAASAPVRPSSFQFTRSLQTLH